MVNRFVGQLHHCLDFAVVSVGYRRSCCLTIGALGYVNRAEPSALRQARPLLFVFLLRASDQQADVEQRSKRHWCNGNCVPIILAVIDIWHEVDFENIPGLNASAHGVWAL